MLKLKRIAIEETPRYGIEIHKKKKFEDERGQLRVIFEGLRTSGEELSFKQSETKAGYGRGLHHQKDPYEQRKLIWVTSGKIIDVFYDPQEQNSVFAVELTDSSEYALAIPSRFAHGFIAITDATFNYCCIGRYNEQSEITINLLPSVASELGLGELKLSKKDSEHSLVRVKLTN